MQKGIFILVASAALLLQCTGGGQSGHHLPVDQAIKTDSIIDAYRKLMFQNPDSAKVSMEQLLLTADNELNKTQEAKIYLQIGIVYSMKMELDKSDSLHRKALAIFENLANPCLLSSVYTNLGINQSKKGNYLSAIELYKRAEIMLERLISPCDNSPEGIYTNLGSSYRSIGKSDSAIYYFEKVLAASKERNDKTMMANAYINLSNIQYSLGEYETMKKYLLQAMQYYEEENNKNGLLTAYTNLASSYTSTKDYDNALLFFYKADSLSTILNLLNKKGLIYHNIGSIYFDKEAYDKGLEYLEKSLDIKMQFKDSVGIAYSRNAISAIYNRTGNYQGAKETAAEALSFAEHVKDANLLLLLYDNLSTSMIYLGEKIEALDVLAKREQLRDSVFSKQKIEAIEDWQVKYETSQKETEIQLLRERHATQQKIMFLYVGIIVLLIVVISFGIVWIRNHRKKTAMQLEQLKYRTVKSKFIPHFTGNILNSINYLISKNLKTAQKYIADFATFTNQSLFSIDKFCNTLKEEITYAENYLNLEKIRFEEILNYSICIIPDVDLQTEIPSMILQTFCENALKHGIRPKNDRGAILINAFYQGKYLVVTVEDDGIGREQAKALKTEGCCEGLKIVEQQIKLYNKSHKSVAYLKIVDLYAEDKTPAGTRFELHMPKQKTI